MVKCTGRGLVVMQPGVLSKVQMLNLVLGVGSFPFFQEFFWGSLHDDFGGLTVLAVLETQWRAPCPPFAGPSNSKYRTKRQP